jgi:hypothetical protein
MGFISTENDPVFTASIAAGILASDTTNWNNKQEQLIAGQGINIIGNTISANNATQAPFHLGQDTLGGIVYYIYVGSDGQQHGLIVSKTEMFARWQSPVSGVGSTRSWDGPFNTNLINNSPAKDWIVTNLGADWYLPSIDELTLLFQNSFHVNSALFNASATLLNTGFYWSSTENGLNNAWVFSKSTFGVQSISKLDFQYIRGVKAF